MGVSQSRLPPVELIDHICTFIDATEDLLNLALVSSAITPVVIPKHIDYRKIRCAFRKPAIWEALASTPILTSQVRFLEVDASEAHQTQSGSLNPPPLLPRVFANDRQVADTCSFDDKQTILEIVRAVQLMTRLRVFRWICFKRPDLAIFEALKRNCADLQVVEILNYDPRYKAFGSLGNLLVGATEAQLPAAQLWRLTNLTHFSYAEQMSELSNARDHDNYVTQMVDMLVFNCPRLEALQLFFCCWDKPGHLLPFQRLFEIGYWPHLKRLTIEASLINSPAKAFFRRHPQIEALAIICETSCPDISDLPCLRSLDYNFPFVEDVSPTSIESLLHLDLVMPGPFEKTFVRQSILNGTTSLSCLVLRFDEDTYCDELMTDIVLPLVKLVPQLERLAICIDPGWLYRGIWGDDDDDKSRNEFDAVFAALPRLTHFSPVPLHFWRLGLDTHDVLEDPDRVNEALAQLIAISPALSPALRFVGVKDNDMSKRGPQWVKVNRNQTGTYCGFENVNGGHGMRQDVDFDLWGGVYYGAGKELFHRPLGDF